MGLFSTKTCACNRLTPTGRTRTRKLTNGTKMKEAEYRCGHGVTTWRWIH